MHKIDNTILIQDDDSTVVRQAYCRKGFGIVFASLAIITAIALAILLFTPASALSIVFGAALITAIGGKVGLSLILGIVCTISAIVATVLLREKKPSSRTPDDGNPDEVVDLHRLSSASQSGCCPRASITV